jgi:uncharacterized membrane-anchored protein YitT (DUF2179 family)
MIITAMLLYGIIQGHWELTYSFAGWIVVTFIADIIIAKAASSDVKIINSNEKTSSEEKYYLRKRTEVEELNRIKLDRELYGR